MTDARTKTEIAADYEAEIGRLRTQLADIRKSMKLAQERDVQRNLVVNTQARQLAERDAEIEKLRQWQQDAATLLVLTLGSIERPSDADLKEHRKVLTRLISEMPIELLSEVNGDD